MWVAKIRIMEQTTYYCSKDIHNIVIFNNNCGNLSSDLLTCLFGNNYLENDALSIPATKCHNMINIYNNTCEVVNTKIIKEETLYHKMFNYNGHVNLYCIPNVLQDVNLSDVLINADLIFYDISINSLNLVKEIDTLDNICQVLNSQDQARSENPEKNNLIKKLLLIIDDCEHLHCNMKDIGFPMTFNHTNINDQSKKEETFATVLNNILKSRTRQYCLEKPIKLSSMKASVYNNLDYFFNTNHFDINVSNLTLSQIDYLGALMYGNFNWDSISSNEKENKLKSRLIFKENEYEQYLQYKYNTGLFTLVSSIQNLLKHFEVNKSCALNYLKTMSKRLEESINAKDFFEKKDLLLELENFLRQRNNSKCSVNKETNLMMLNIKAQCTNFIRLISLKSLSPTQELQESISTLLNIYDTINSLSNINELTNNACTDIIKKLIVNFILENTFNEKRGIDDITYCIQIISEFKHILNSLEQAEAASNIILSYAYIFIKPDEFITLMTNLCNKYSLDEFFIYHFILKLVQKIYISIGDALVSLRNSKNLNNQTCLTENIIDLCKYLYPIDSLPQEKINFYPTLIFTYYLYKADKFWNHPYVNTCADSNEHLCKIAFLINYINKKNKEHLNLHRIIDDKVKLTKVSVLTFEKYLVNNFGFLKTE